MKTRKDVAESDRWDVAALYESADEWEGEFPTPPWKEIDAFRGKLGEGVGAVKGLLEAYFAAARVVERLYVYAHLKNDEDLANDVHKGMYQRAVMLHCAFGEACSWIEPELLALSEEVLQGYLAAKELAEYRFYLEKIVRLKPHTLTPREEELVAMAARPLQTASQAFSAMTNADFDFGKVVDGEGKELDLSPGTYLVYQRSPDRVLRENSFKKLHSQFAGFENSIGELLGGQVQAHHFGARSHHFESCLEAAIFPKNIDKKVYHALIEAVHAGLPKLHRYMEVRKELLGVEELHLWDTYVPLVQGVAKKIPYDEAVSMVVESVAPLGKPYQDQLACGMGAERWVDKYENEGKRSGAYSSGCFDSHPYILMNYNGLLNDALTLAHEAGHSMHSWLSRKNQPYHYADYPIFVAEVASTFNEELLFRLLMERAGSKEERLFLINQKIDDIRATLFRQTMFAEFELAIHEMVERGEPLTPSVLKEKYFELNRTYFGPHVTLDQEIEIEWARIPHFYYNFYVYQYATGISAALSLAERVLAGGEAERDAYLGFLSGGSSKYPIDLLKGAGVDVTTPEPVERAIGIFGGLTESLVLDWNR